MWKVRKLGVTFRAESSSRIRGMQLCKLDGTSCLNADVKQAIVCRGTTIRYIIYDTVSRLLFLGFLMKAKYLVAPYFSSILTHEL